MRLFRRNVSLYYGSISVWRSLQGIGAWLIGGLISAHTRRSRLHARVREKFYPASAGVFSLGSGRSALAACLKAADVGVGDDVLVSAYTCLAVPTAIVATGARPVYVDINAESLNVDAQCVLAAISPSVKAIIVQHTLGKVAPVQAILAEARAQGIWVIEDCALSVGSKLDGQWVGSFADAAIVSMELSKTLSAGWGGLLIVNEETLAKKVSILYETLPTPSWLSASRDLWQTVISSWLHKPFVPGVVRQYALAVGFKSGVFRPSTPVSEFEGHIKSNFLLKMSGVQAALATYQWGDFSRVAIRCKQHARQLREALSQLDVTTPGSPETNEELVAPRVSCLVANRALMIDYFKKQGVELGQWFDGPLSPIPTQACFNYQEGNYPVAEHIAKHVVNFPCHSGLCQKDIRSMIQLLMAFMQQHSTGKGYTTP